jgi:hypothetical protein
MEYYGNHNRYVAGGGTTALGIIGTVAGGASLLNNGNGLGGLFGGNTLQKENAALQSEVATLRAEKYSDTNDAKLFDVIRNLEKEQATTAADVRCLKQELTTYEISQREILDLREKLVKAEIGKVDGKVDCLAGTVETAVCSFNGKINAINAKIGGFTKTVIQQSAICDVDGDGCCGGGQQ